MMQSLITVWGELILIALVMPYVGSAVISAVTRRTDQLLVNRFGGQAQYYFSFFGIVVHELSHALMALIFRHKIDGIKLVQRGKDDQKLGYVSHAWNPKSLYQQLGNFFIGMGPIFGIGLAVWLTTYWCWPQALSALMSMDGHALFVKVTWWKIGLNLFLCMQFCLALNLSQADWQNIQSGLFSYFIFLTFCALPVYLIVRDTNALWENFGRYGLAFFFIMFILSIVIDITFNLLFRTKK